MSEPGMQEFKRSEPDDLDRARLKQRIEALKGANDNLRRENLRLQTALNAALIVIEGHDPHYHQQAIDIACAREGAK